MGKIPNHVAVIMDGNGRWALERGLSRIEGHKAGIKTVREITRVSRESGVKYLTLYAFSSENWKRSKMEVLALMNLLKRFLAEEVKEMNENGIRLLTIGRTAGLPSGVQKQLKKTIQATENNTEMTLVLALNYGARNEILDAVNSIIRDIKKDPRVKMPVTEDIFSSKLYTAGMPEPDLLIRTSGEKRLSNFLLWQLSYAEFWFTPTLWPDFSKEEFMEALRSFADRQRRFGGAA